MSKKRPTPPSTLSDIAFLLLLFFLIMAISSVQAPVPIHPAQAQGQTRDLSEVPTLLVSQDGLLYFEGNQVELTSLPFSEEYALLADRNTAYKTVHPIIEFLKSQGVKTLHTLVEQPQ
jgi:biopolymer transport protein ExbD